jgi:beta-glucosidase
MMLTDDANTTKARSSLVGTRLFLDPFVQLCTDRHIPSVASLRASPRFPIGPVRWPPPVVAGCQGKGVAATIKHFAADEQETRRLSVNGDSQ